MTKITTYEELESFLTNWINWTGEGGYDVIGILNLLKSCLGNLNRFSTEEDFNDIGDFFSKEELDVMKVILSKTKLNQ